MEIAQIMQSWRDGCLADHEAILQLIASPGDMADSLASIAEIARMQESIMRSRSRAKFETFIEEQVCVEAIGASLSAQIIAVLMAAWDRDEISWQPGESVFTFFAKGA